MDLELAGKVAVVTGGSKGIGLAIARTLAAEGVQVIVGARSVEAMPAIDGVSALAVDLARPDGPQELVALALERHGGVDVLVNNVGAAPVRLDGFLSLDDDAIEATLRLNFFAALRAMRAVLPSMLERQGGAIVKARPTYGSARQVSPRPWPRRRAATPPPSARRSRPRSRPAGSPRPRRSPRLWRSWPRRGPRTSPARSTSSTALIKTL